MNSISDVLNNFEEFVKDNYTPFFHPYTRNSNGGAFLIKNKTDSKITALLKPSEHIEHSLMFQEPVNGEYNTLQLNFFDLLSV
jgi:hypothetical protein